MSFAHFIHVQRYTIRIIVPGHIRRSRVSLVCCHHVSDINSGRSESLCHDTCNCSTTFQSFLAYMTLVFSCQIGIEGNNLQILLLLPSVQDQIARFNDEWFRVYFTHVISEAILFTKFMTCTVQGVVVNVDPFCN